MTVTVPCANCGAELDVVALLGADESRRAFAQLIAISVPLGRLVLQYLSLFRPATRALGQGRAVKLVEQLLPDLQRGAIAHKGREWAAPLEAWRTAIEQLLAQRDKGRLVLPLGDHAYLYATLAGMADQAEAAREAEAEIGRRTRSGAPPVQAGDALLQPRAAVSRPIDYSKPSRAALEVKARMAAAAARRGTAAGEPEEPST